MQLPPISPTDLPVLAMSVQIYDDGRVILNGVPNDPRVLLDIIRMISEQHLKAAVQANARKAGIVIPHPTIRRGPSNGV